MCCYAGGSLFEHWIPGCCSHTEAIQLHTVALGAAQSCSRFLLQVQVVTDAGFLPGCDHTYQLHLSGSPDSLLQQVFVLSVACTRKSLAGRAVVPVGASITLLCLRNEPWH